MNTLENRCERTGDGRLRPGARGAMPGHAPHMHTQSSAKHAFPRTRSTITYQRLRAPVHRRSGAANGE